MKKLLTVTVKGRSKTWSFTILEDIKYIQDWIDDGLEVYELCNIVPEVVQRYGLTKLWCFLQDIFNFKNPFRK
jgi:hypothetical protein